MIDDNSLISFSSSVSEEINKIGADKLQSMGFTDKGIDDFKNYVFEAIFWKDLSESSTPIDRIKIREGHQDKDGNVVMVEYVPEDYVISELNRLFPGWWTEDMKRSPLEEIIKLQTVVVEGYLMIPYLTPNGTKVRKLWAIADNAVKFKKNTTIPVDIGNNFKGGRTEWVRIAAKWLGIGLDIYHQKITPDLRRMFEDRIRKWLDYADHWKAVAATCETGKTFRTLLVTMPSEEQVMRVIKALENVSDERHAKIWENFGKLSNSTEQNRKQFEQWLKTLEEMVKKKENSN